MPKQASRPRRLPGYRLILWTLVSVTPYGCALPPDLILVDSHIDLPLRLEEDPEDVTARAERGTFDYPRAVRGQLDVAFMSIYVPSYLESAGASAHADRLIALVENLERRAPGKFAIARTVADVRRNVEQGIVSIPMGLENGAPLEGRLDNVERYHQRGIRYITLTHNASNHICDSSFDMRRPWRGLSPFGRTVVKEMNRVGIMIDVSHVSDEAFDEVLDLSRAPVIASHSGLRHFVPGLERNMSDEMIRRLAADGGVIQLNFSSAFLLPQGADWLARLHGELERPGARSRGNAATAKVLEDFQVAHPLPRASLKDVADQIDYVVRLVGVDHIGFGSDFDGAGDTMPEGLRDVSQYPNLLHELSRRGYSASDVAKIAGGNLLRVWSEVERYAAAQRKP